ncbi:MAG: septum formation initiator family protein [Oscillospiraceae bacterium]
MATKREMAAEKKKSRLKRRRKLVSCAAFFVCVYLVISIVSVQISIYKEKQTLAALQQKIEQRQMENDELNRVVSDGEGQYIERIAREKLGYAAVDERVFVDLAGA